MKITTGTNCFPTTAHACFYYSFQHPFAMPKEIKWLVENKKDTGEIIIGNPELKAGQEKKLVDNRWHICE
jgi:hypothetical protein